MSDGFGQTGMANDFDGFATTSLDGDGYSENSASLGVETWQPLLELPGTVLHAAEEEEHILIQQFRAIIALPWRWDEVLLIVLAMLPIMSLLGLCFRRCCCPAKVTPAETDSNVSSPNPSRDRWRVDEVETAADAYSLSDVYSIRYGFHSRTGFDAHAPGHENQDAYSVVRGIHGAHALALGVFDGHGEEGESCSVFAADSLEGALEQSTVAVAGPPARGRNETALRGAFERLNTAMHGSRELDDRLSGATAVVALFEGHTCWVAHAGDSRAVLGSVHANGGRRLVASALSTDHTASRADERARVRACGAEIASHGQRQRKQLVGDDYWEQQSGLSDRPLVMEAHQRTFSRKPKQRQQEAEAAAQGRKVPRVWAPHNAQQPGCRFTRSLGHRLAEGVGLVAEPEVVRHELQPHDRCVCLCSDGVWEFLSEQAVVDLVARHDDPRAACRAVVAEAYSLWMQYDVRSDDLTCAIAFIDHDDRGYALDEALSMAKRAPSSPGLRTRLRRFFAVRSWMPRSGA